MPSRGGGTSILCSWPCQSLHGSPTDQRPPAASQNPGVQSGHRIPQVAVASASVAGGCGHCLVQAGARTYPPGGRLGHPTTWGGPGDRRTEFWGYVAPGKEPTGATCSHRMQCRSCVTEAWGGGNPGAKSRSGGTPGRGASGEDPGAWSCSWQSLPGDTVTRRTAHCREVSWPWGRCVFLHCVALGFWERRLWLDSANPRPHGLLSPPVAAGKEGWERWSPGLLPKPRCWGFKERDCSS